MAQNTIDDTQNLFGWSTIFTITDDATELLLVRETLFDNGLVKLEDFDAGIRTTTRRLDNVDEYTGEPSGPSMRFWTEIYSTYDGTGVIDLRETLYDDGVLKRESFEAGVRSSMHILDNLDKFTGEPTGPSARAWSEIYTSYDENGVIELRDTVYDNGVLKLEAFEAGVRSSTHRLDNLDEYTGEPTGPSAKSWSEILTNFDENGDISYRETAFDNGVSKLEDFNAGVRTSTNLLDNLDEYTHEPTGPSAKLWSEIYIEYDENGAVDSRETYYDNGVLKIEGNYSDGWSYKLELDNVDEDTYEPIGPSAKNWSDIYTEYDENGVIDLRETYFDNGISKMEGFEAGVLVYKLQLDNVDAESGEQYGPSVKAWLGIVTEYDLNGVISLRQTYFDNGVAKYEEFAGGVRSAMLQLDNIEGPVADPEGAGVKLWTAIASEFDETGALETRQIEYDSGDVKYLEFEDGNQITNARYDGDDSEEWLARISTYETDGTLLTDEFYFAEEDIPALYLDIFV